MNFRHSGETKKLDQVLTDYGITHFYESYDGDHLNRIAERIQTKTLPFFSQNLSFEKAKAVRSNYFTARSNAANFLRCELRTARPESSLPR